MKKVIFALAICATIVSCQKKEDTQPIDVSKTTFVMDKGWQLKLYTILPNVNDSFGVANPVTIQTCQTDDYLTFNTVNRVSLHQGITKCTIGTPDSTIYGYTLSANDTHLQIYTNPDDATHGIYLEGDVTYPSIDTFIVKWRGPNQNDSTLTAEYKKTYVKYQ